MTLSSHVQKSSLGERVELFDLDASTIGGGVHHFVNGTSNDSQVLWQGRIYMPRAIKAEGFEVNGEGTLPRPKLTVSHINSAFEAVVREFGDLVGATVVRWRTFSKFLDNGSHPDSNAHFAPDIYVIDCKSAANKIFIEWELAAALDQEGKKLPARQVLQSVCCHRYRHWDGVTFSYDAATCPYSGVGYFDRLGQPTSAPSDCCGKRLSDCKIRHPNQTLPFGGFPGVTANRSA